MQANMNFRKRLNLVVFTLLSHVGTSSQAVLVIFSVYATATSGVAGTRSLVLSVVYTSILK